jgi:hypothetical protein
VVHGGKLKSQKYSDKRYFISRMIFILIIGISIKFVSDGISPEIDGIQIKSMIDWRELVSYGLR